MVPSVEQFGPKLQAHGFVQRKEFPDADVPVVDAGTSDDALLKSYQKISKPCSRSVIAVFIAECILEHALFPSYSCNLI